MIVITEWIGNIAATIDREDIAAAGNYAADSAKGLWQGFSTPFLVAASAGVALTRWARSTAKQAGDWLLENYPIDNVPT